MVCTVIMEIIYVSLLTEKVKGNDMYWGIVAFYLSCTSLINYASSYITACYLTFFCHS